MGIPLFIAEATGTCRLSLRRYRSDEDDQGHWHNASVVIDGDAPVTPPKPDGTKPFIDDGRVPHDDPRWPAACTCGEAFTDDDQWQVNESDWYEGGGQRFTWGSGNWDGPPGAMFRAPWQDDITPDNGLPAWIIFLPNGTYWCTRDRSSGGGNKIGPQWSVSGTPPRITVNPSINDQSSRPWHGWIRDGEMVPA
jgi:hypothetical protein